MRVLDNVTTSSAYPTPGQGCSLGPLIEALYADIQVSNASALIRGIIRTGTGSTDWVYTDEVPFLTATTLGRSFAGWVGFVAKDYVSGTHAQVTAVVWQKPDGRSFDPLVIPQTISTSGVVTSSGTPIATSWTLAASSTAAASSIQVNGTIPAGFAAKASLVAIDAWSANCELRQVNSVSGQTFTLDRALLLAHSAGVPVVWLPTADVNPSLFDCQADGTNDWQNLQRCCREAAMATTAVHGANRTYSIGQPLMLTEQSLRYTTITSRTGFAPIDATNAMVMLASRIYGGVTASASTDTFTGPSGVMSAYDQTNTTRVVFMSLYGETLPGGITAGRVYFVKTVTGTTQFTISATAGGATLDITSNGTCYTCGGVYELSRLYWDTVTLTVERQNLNALMAGIQQPGYTRNMRINMNAAATQETTGFRLKGQISNHHNTEINPSGGANLVGLDINYGGGAPYGHNFFGINLVGSNAAGVIGIRANSVACHLGGVWLESFGTNPGILIDVECRGLSLGVVFLSSTHPGLRVTTTNSSYTLDSMHDISGAGGLMIEDTARPWSGYAWDGNTPGTGLSDNQFVIAGLRQPYGSFGPVLGVRVQRAVTAAYTARLIDTLVKADAAGGAFTVTLPTAAGIGQWAVTVKRINSGANAVTVGTTGGQTIDGAATVALASQWDAITVMSDGTNWQIESVRPAALGL